MNRLNKTRINNNLNKRKKTKKLYNTNIIDNTAHSRRNVNLKKAFIYYNVYKKKARSGNNTNIKKHNLLNICTYILITFMLLLLMYFIFNNDTFIYDSSNYNFDCCKCQYNTIEKNSFKIFTESKYINKLVSIQDNKPNIDDKYNNSVILNKLKNLYFKEAIAREKIYKNNIFQLEKQINDNKTAYYNLIRDIGNIIK